MSFRQERNLNLAVDLCVLDPLLTRVAYAAAPAVTAAITMMWYQCFCVLPGDNMAAGYLFCVIRLRSHLIQIFT